MKRNVSAIDAFWTWFAANSHTIGEMLARSLTDDIVRDLEKNIKLLGQDLEWELGPGCARRYALVISPGRVMKNLALTKAIVARAPVIKDWEFHSARPPKKWSFRFEIANKRGQTVGLDASGWRYALVAYNKGEFFDVTLVAESLPSLDRSARQHAAHIVLEALLGEERLMSEVGEVDLVERVDRSTESRLSSISDLPEHLSYLRSQKE